MKLTEYNVCNSKMARVTKPMISISQRVGLMTFNRKAAAKLNLKPGDKVVFLQDEENKTDWYLKVSNDSDGFKLRRGSNSTGLLNFNCKKIASEIAESIGVSGPFRCLISTEKTEEGNYPIITRSAMPKPY